MTAPRSYAVEYRPAFNGSGLHWRLYLYGAGHWCVANGDSGSYPTEAEAIHVGETWVSTGIQPCEQERADTLLDCEGILGVNQQLRGECRSQASATALSSSGSRPSSGSRRFALQSHFAGD